MSTWLESLIAYNIVLVQVLLEGEKCGSKVGARLTLKTTDLSPYTAVVQVVSQSKIGNAFQDMRPLCGLLPRSAEVVDVRQ